MGNPNANTQMFYTRPSDGATYCFSPVPLLGQSREFLKTGSDEQILSITNQLTFTGTLLPMKPALTGVAPGASCLQLLDIKSDQLSSALEDFGDLLIVDGSGYIVTAVTPRVTSLSFDESQIVSDRKYSITFEYDTDFGTNRVKDYTEDWAFEQGEDDTVAVSHNITAVGVANSGIGSSIANARLFVVSKIAGAAPDGTQIALLKTPYTQALVDATTLNAFNHVLTESSDITAGSYSATETWTLSSGNYKDDRTVEHTFDLRNDDVLIETISINGTIQGYGDTTFDKLTSALNGWENTVKGEINFDAASGITTKNYSENRFAGTVSYSLTRAAANTDDELIQDKTISRSIERSEDGSVTQTVTTSASIRPGSSGLIQTAIDFCFENNFPITFADPSFNAALSGNILSKSVQRDELAKSFSLTRSFVDQTTALWTEEYSVSRDESTDTSQLNITVQGTIQGIGEESSNKSQDRFASASGAYYSIVEPLIFGRAQQIVPTGSCINSEAITFAFGFTPFNGVITYAKTFTSRFKTTNQTILSEEVEVSFTNQAQVVVEIQIPGKADGPILQDQETLTGLEKQLSISYGMASSGNACDNSILNSAGILATAITESDILVNNTPSANPRGEKPESSKVFKTQDQYSFNRQTLQFNRNVSWKYI